MSFNKRIKDLVEECGLLGISATPTRKIKSTGEMRHRKDDYITALRNYHLAKKYPNGIPWHLHYMLQIPSPMLAARYNELKPPQQREIWESPDWTFETKHDGCRMVLIYVRGEGLHLYSRNISQVDYCPCEYENVWTQFDIVAFERDHPETVSLILDSEIMASNVNVSTIMGSRGVITETQLQAVAALLQLNAEDSIRIQQESCPLYFETFDFLLLNGEWVTHLPCYQRMIGLSNTLPILQSYGMDLRTAARVQGPGQKRALYQSIIASGGEGVIAKHLESTYKASVNRDKKAWVKIKRTMTETLQGQGLADSLDAWVSGFEPGERGKAHEGMVGTLVFNINVDGKTHEIARVSGLSDEDRKAATLFGPNGEVQLNPTWLGKVAELDGQCISSRSKRLKHARIIRWRPDKSPEACMISQAFLDSMVL